MTRKLFSTLLCAFALLLLMGAGIAPEEDVTILAEEESASVSDDAALEIDDAVEANSQTVSAAAGVSPIELEENTESGLLVDGVCVPAEVSMEIRNGVTYVALAPMAAVLDETAQVTWDGASGVVTVTTEKLSLTAKVGQLYLEANGRYLYLPEKVQLTDGRVKVPLRAIAKAFDAQVGWNAETGVITVSRGSGGIQSGASYYDEEMLFWLSRIIYAESGNQSLEGQMAVGNVVMNRVASPSYPNSVKEVLAQKNQFSTYKSGALANRTPNTSSILAAKLVLDGGVVARAEGALYFDSSTSSWASRNRECIAVIGGHNFYR